MVARIWLLCLILQTSASGQETWPPPELAGGWKLHRIEIARNGVQEEDLQNLIPPTFCVFVDDHHFWFQDRDAKFVIGAKLKIHQKKEDSFYLVWNYYRNIRIQILKETDQTLRMVTESVDKDGSKIRTVFQMERVEAGKTRAWIQALLDDGPHESMVQLRDESKELLKKLLAAEE